MIGVGHNHALDVFDDAAAGLDHDRLRQAAQEAAGFGGGIGQGDGLSAAHGWNELLVEDSGIQSVGFVGALHIICVPSG